MTSPLTPEKIAEGRRLEKAAEPHPTYVDLDAESALSAWYQDNAPALLDAAEEANKLMRDKASGWAVLRDVLDQQNTKSERALEEVIEDRDRFGQAITDTHVALGFDGEWTAKPGRTFVAGETGDLAIDVPALARDMRSERDALRAKVERYEAEPTEAEMDEFRASQTDEDRRRTNAIRRIVLDPTLLERCADERDALRAEVGELREALKKILSMESLNSSPGDLIPCDNPDHGRFVDGRTTAKNPWTCPKCWSSWWDVPYGMTSIPAADVAYAVARAALAKGEGAG
jgi:hypothetical protein